MREMVGTTQQRLCPTLRRSAIALGSVSLHDLIELPADQPGQAEEGDQHHDAQIRRGIVVSA
jgi:hypothetical protein